MSGRPRGRPPMAKGKTSTSSSSTKGTMKSVSASVSKVPAKRGRGRPRVHGLDGAADEEDSDIAAPTSETPFLKPSGKVSSNRASTSSESVGNDLTSASDLNTPLTSAFATPAPTTDRKPVVLIKKPAEMLDDDDDNPNGTAQIAKRLRDNSQYSLNPSRASKRKRPSFYVDDDEDEDDEEDNSASAKLARKLQAEEYARGDNLPQFSSTSSSKASRVRSRLGKSLKIEISDEDSDNKLSRKVPRVTSSSRPSRLSAPKSLKIADSDEDSDNKPIAMSSSKPKRFSGVTRVPDSDEASEFGPSDDDEDFVLPKTSARKGPGRPKKEPVVASSPVSKAKALGSKAKDSDRRKTVGGPPSPARRGRGRPPKSVDASPLVHKCQECGKAAPDMAAVSGGDLNNAPYCYPCYKALIKRAPHGTLYTPFSSAFPSTTTKAPIKSEPGLMGPPQSRRKDSTTSLTSLSAFAATPTDTGSVATNADENDDGFWVDSDGEVHFHSDDEDSDSDEVWGSMAGGPGTGLPRHRSLRHTLVDRGTRRALRERAKLEKQHPEILTMWKDLEAMPVIKTKKAPQPKGINRELKPFQLEGLAWMQAIEKTAWGGGLLGDEMGMGKTIQAVSLIMSDWPAKQPSLVLVPPVALMQWQQEISSYTDGTLRTFVYHGTQMKSKGMTVAELKKFDVILMSYNSLESMYRKQEKGFKRKAGLHKEQSVIHKINFHRVILDEAHNIKQRTTGVARACFALKADHKWCLSGTPLQNRIGEFFSLIRFLNIEPFACYFCKQCDCSSMNWAMGENSKCTDCNHSGMQHVSVFNQELLNPIQKHGNKGPGKEAFRKLRLLTDRFMLRRVKRDHSSSMELPSKEIYVDRQFFGEEENDFASSIMNNSTRRFETYVSQGVMLNNYANIFGLIMQMRQVADHPDLILKKDGEGGQNIIACCICDETAEDAIRSTCKHDFCRTCVKNYVAASDDTPGCPVCHIPLSIDLEQPEIEQDATMVKKSSIVNRIKMENWTSSSKIENLVHNLHELRSKNSSSKSIIFSQFTTMLQLVEWRLRRAGFSTVMLDGSMTPAQRQASINHFMTDVSVEVFLVSLKAGGVALNLTEASRVFIVDPWWNPAAEWQSADRCHRIGQGRPCTITRLCIEDSVESRMVLLQEKKANMINSTINADESAMESLTPEDLQFLFRGS